MAMAPFPFSFFSFSFPFLAFRFRARTEYEGKRGHNFKKYNYKVLRGHIEDTDCIWTYIHRALSLCPTCKRLNPNPSQFHFHSHGGDAHIDIEHRYGIGIGRHEAGIAKAKP
jgi:hypothetical protein